MKNILVALFVLFCIPVSAQFLSDAAIVEGIYKKIPNNDPCAFWMTLSQEHPQNIAIMKAIKNRKKSMVQAFNELNLQRPEYIRSYVSRRSINTPEAKELIKSIERIVNAERSFPAIKFFVVEDHTQNACMFYDGSCAINSYWLNSDAKIEELVALCCHETAHYALIHVIRDAWKKVKAAKRNAIWAEIGTGLAMGVYAGSQMYSAQYGVAQSNEAQQQMYNNITAAGINAYNEGQWIAEFRQKFKYKRETETEADEVAFWFMEKNDIDPIHLINLFKKMGSDKVRLTREEKKTSEHPEMSKRIKHLEKMYKRYHNKK